MSIMEDSRKMLWRTIINVVVAALSAIATALGVTSCMEMSAKNHNKNNITSPLYDGSSLRSLKSKLKTHWATIDEPWDGTLQSSPMAFAAIGLTGARPYGDAIGEDCQ